MKCDRAGKSHLKKYSSSFIASLIKAVSLAQLQRLGLNPGWSES